MDESRRKILGLSAAFLMTNAASPARASQSTLPPPPRGRPGDFDFLSGEWRIHNRWRSSAASTEWLEFPGEATVIGILGGIASVEELRIPARNFFGMGLRLLDVSTNVWSDFWVNKNSGVLTTPGQTGGFVDGVGTFSAEDMDGDRPIIAQGIWDNISAATARWRQRVSYDAGATWEESWIMDWTRA